MRNPSSRFENEIAPVPSDDKFGSDFGTKNIEFERIKERITHHVCAPFIEQMDFVDYCGFAKMPGVWLASSKRKGVQISKVAKFREKSGKTKTSVYNHKQHLVKNCLRQLLRREYESFLGKCHYSMTSYKNLLRIVKPLDDGFLLALNVKPIILNDDFAQFIEACHCSDAEKIKEMEKICDEDLKICVRELRSLDKQAWSSDNKEKLHKEILADFFSNEPKRFVQLRSLLKKTFSNKKILYTSIGKLNGLPLARYVNTDNHFVDTDKPMFLDEIDEIEYFIDSTSGLKMRDDFSRFFGATKFNLSVYEKIAVMTIPVGKDFFALLSLENKMNNKDASEAEKDTDKDFYFPKSMKKICSFINEKERDIKYITADL